MINVQYDEIGSFIAKLRREKNLTQKDLASKLGVTDKAVSKWERGLGCPDVSLLETLSKVLNVSILELLKGKRIDVQELNENNANEFIIETVNYSKKEKIKKYKRILLNILSCLIVTIVIVLTLANILQMIYLNRNISYTSNDFLIDKVHDDLKILDKNISIIKDNLDIFSQEDYFAIISNLEQIYNGISNSKLLKIQGKYNLKLKELYDFNKNSYKQAYIVRCYEILSKYDPRMTLILEMTKHDFINKAYLNNNLYNDSINIYKYEIIFNDSLFDIENNIYELLALSSQSLLLSQYVMEVGEINE
ncbi:MAG: helix-turn-helix transcriptional regulator [Firmicutes bacterium]|nr:helix-turn-helix transcriptional regulator [Bacillota bacterium]